MVNESDDGNDECYWEDTTYVMTFASVMYIWMMMNLEVIIQ